MPFLGWRKVLVGFGAGEYACLDSAVFEVLIMVEDLSVSTLSGDLELVSIFLNSVVALTGLPGLEAVYPAA